MLGPRIAALRRAAGWSQSELARRLKISPSAVGMYEQGRREPAVETLIALSELFGVTTDYLLKGRPSTPAEERLTADTLRQTLAQAEKMLDRREDRPFSLDELALVLTAMLSEP